MALLDFPEANFALSAGLLSGNLPQGLLGFGRAISQQKANALREQLLQAQIGETQAQAQERAMKIRQQEQAMQEQARWRDLIGNAGRPKPGMGATGAVNAALPPEMQIGAQPQIGSAGIDYRDLFQKGVPYKMLEELAGTQNLGLSEVARVLTEEGPGGAKIEQQRDKFGRPVGPAINGYVAPVAVGQGDRTTFVKPAAGMSLPMNMTFADRNAAANLALSRQRLAFDQNNAVAGKAPAGYRFRTDGGLEFIPGGPADPARNGEKIPSEGERKAATLLQRLNGSQAQLSAVLQTSPGAAKPEIIPAMIGKVAGATPANIATSGPRQQIEAAQLDMLDAALTLGTGAAYTKEQLEGYRKSYFPQIGDDSRTVADKQARLQNVIEAAKIAAGRAGGQATVPRQNGASGGWSIQKVN